VFEIRRSLTRIMHVTIIVRFRPKTKIYLFKTISLLTCHFRKYESNYKIVINVINQFFLNLVSTPKSGATWFHFGNLRDIELL